MRRRICTLLTLSRGAAARLPGSVRIPLILLLLPLYLTPPAPVAAQEMTPADSAAVLLEAARTFQADGNWEVAEALFHFISERFGQTPAGMEARSVLRAAPPEGPSRASQVELMVWGTTYGLWLGVAIPGAFDASGSGAYGAGLLLGGPVGFLGSRALARSRSLSEGQVRAITFGSLWGTWQGWGIMEVLDLGEGKEHCNFDYCYREDPDGSDVLRSMILGGIAGIATGAVLARKPISSGMATTVNFGGLWGTWFGFAGGTLLGLEDDDLLASTLVGGNGGLVSTALLNRQWDLSRARARLISIGGVIGLLGGFGLDLIFQPDGEKAVMAIPLAGSIVGLAAAAAATRDRSGSVGPGGASGTMSGGRLTGGRNTGRPWGGSGTSGALLDFSRGRFGLDAPRPFPTLVPVDAPNGFSLRPALAVNLLSASF